MVFRISTCNTMDSLQERTSVLRSLCHCRFYYLLVGDTLEEFWTVIESEQHQFSEQKI